MLPVISRALTPAPRARRTFALTLALVLGAVPVTSAVSAQPAANAAEAHAAKPAVNLQLVIKAEQPKDDPSYVECVANFLGTMSATPGVWAVCHGYLDSEEYTVTRRHSGANVTRGQLVRMLYRMAGSPTVKNLPKTSPYKDVATTNPDYPAYIWAADAGITSGWDDGLFHPDDYATRHTLAAFLYRAAGSPDGAARLRQIRRPLRAEVKKTEQFKTENRWAARTLGAYPEADRDGDGAADVVNPASPLYFSDALYMLKAYGDKGLKVVGTPVVD
ncbi:S-layer homology domain-containing protein [Rothia sp. HMSC069C10]|uniref:S-layer homology domain-containing protein n=1 Tax=Rothia sp. HMSC069C10 TaxID=1739346 RepID=UPI0008A4736E|nr:S-layer homology domain-containing protein [Rothia sp. HMSC069C10]OFJ78819.1 metal ABC transporter substrate-binding protein [Rothia sp. HMSC069C10]